MKEPCHRLGSSAAPTFLCRRLQRIPVYCIILCCFLSESVAPCPQRIKGYCAYQIPFFGEGPPEPGRPSSFYEDAEGAGGLTPLIGPPGMRNSPGTVLSDFNVKVLSAPTAQHLQAVRHCAGLAAEHWTSAVEVRVKVVFARHVGGADVLGEAKAGTTWSVDGFAYPVGMAKSILALDVNGDNYGDERLDVIMRLNSLAPWYTGFDARPPADRYDLVTVCLHELYHGLMMSGGNINVTRGGGDGAGATLVGRFLTKYRGRFDAFLAAGTAAGDCAVESYRGRPESIADAVAGDNLWFYGGGARVAQLYAPREYNRGSSIYHLSEAQYGGPSGADGLMTPAMPLQYARHSLGPLVRRMQELMLDTAERGAPACNGTVKPIVLSTTGDKNGNATVATKACTVKMGSACLSRNVVIGVSAGGVVVLLTLIVLVGVLVQRYQAKREIELPPLHSGDPAQHLGDRFFND